MPACTLTTIPTWFTCVQGGLPFTEIVTIIVFSVFFILFKNYGTREALPPALFISTITAIVFLGMNVINPAFVMAVIILTAASTVFLFTQNTV